MNRNHLVLPRSPILLFASIFLLAILAALTAGRGRMGMGPSSYDYAHQALLLASGRVGDGLGLFPTWPPGFALLLTPLVCLGVSPLKAEWGISIVAFGLTSCLTFALGRLRANTLVGAVAALIVIFNPTMLDWANMAMSEMLFTFSILMSIFWVDSVYIPRVASFAGAEEATSSRMGLFAATAFFVCLPFWIRYIGIVVPVIALCGLAVMAVLLPEGRRALLTTAALAGLLLAVVPLRNLIATGGPTGHAIGVVSSVAFATAMSQALRAVRTMWFFLAERFRADMVDAVTALVLLFAAVFHGRRLRSIPSAVIPLIYLVALAWAASHTRIDRISDRFVMPMFPLIVLGLSGATFELLTLASKESRPRPRRNLKTAAVMVIVPLLALSTLAVSRGGGLVLTGFTPFGGYWSPETIRYIKTQIPGGTTIAVSRYGGQLGADTLSYRVRGIPFADPPNDGYTAAYGIEPWTRLRALLAFIENDVSYVVFFLGTSGHEPFLEHGWYGAYVGSLPIASLPEIAEVKRLADGIVISLLPRDRLTELFEREYPDTRLPR
jgi:hypothetical protein